MILHNNQAINIHKSATTNASQALQTWLEISSAAFNHNVAYYKNKIGHHNQLAAVIKGNGYGHGLHHMAYLCEHNNQVDWLLVAHLSEALALQNITKPILVMNYSDVSPEYAVGKNIHFTVDNLAYAQNLHNIGKKHSYNFHIHIKIDTGLSRMGILASDTLNFITQLQQLDYISIHGIYSHFSASDSNPELTTQQYTQFNDVLASLQSNNICIPNIHLSNSAAISTVTYQPHFNFFRIGVGLYGLGQEYSNLKPVMSWKTHITNIKNIPANSYVSYACTYKTERPTRIALLPIGYVDGYQFRFSNKTSVMINGSYAPILGRVAMNITIIDVTDITAYIDDEVIIMGAYPNIGAHDLAEMGEIRNIREFLVGINPTINRIVT